MASVEELKARSKASIDSRFSFKSWLHAAQKTRNLAEEADNKGDVEGAYVGYRKTVNLIRAMLDHPEYKNHVTHKSSPEYYSYMDLKSKLLPTTSRMQELERTLMQRERHEGQHQQQQQAQSHTPVNGEHHEEHFSPSHHVQDIAGIFNHMSVTPSSTGGSAGSTSRTAANGASSLTSAALAKGAPPPVPSTSTKPPPPVPSPSSKPAFPSPTSSAAAKPGSPSQPTSTHHGWAGMGAATHKVSSRLKERMAMLHNAGMKDVHESSHDEHVRTPSSASSLDGGKPAVNPKPTINGGLRRSPAVHYGQTSTATSSAHSNGSDSTLPVSHSNGDQLPSLASTIPSQYSQDDSMPDPWPPKSLAPKTSTEGLKRTVPSPDVSALPDTEDRPGSAPPATNGPPDASGPASSSVDWLTRSYESATDTYLTQTNHDRSTSHSPALDTPATLDSFADRFPDVEHVASFSSPTQHRPTPTSHSGITQPFLPAPNSQNTLQYQGMNVRTGRSDTQSSVQTQSTDGSTDTAHRMPNGYLGQMSPKPPAPSAQVSKPPRPLPKPPSLPSLPNRAATTIEPQELWRFLEASGSPGQPSILLVDVRTRKEYSSGHVKGKTVCIEPFTLSSNSSAWSIENSLEVSPDMERKWFAERASFDLIVMYDKSTKALPSRDSASYSNTSSGPVTFRSIADQVEDSAVSARTLATLSKAIYELNFSDADKRLKRSPLLLVGGFEAWAKQIGDKGIQQEAYAQPQYHHYHQNRDRPHEHHSMPALQPSRPPSGPPASHQSKVESEYQSMLANRAQAEVALGARPQSEPTEASPDTKRQHRKAVLSGDSILSPSPLQNVHLPGPPPPAYSGIAIPPVAAHRTGPASPYEAYPSSSFQSIPFSQGPSHGEYFEQQYSSPQKNGYPGAQPGTSYQQQYPTSRAIEYPTLQQKQQFGSGPVQRPGISMTADSANHVQRPAPTLARASSSSLHLYQHGDYLNAPAFGAFPKPLMALGDGVVGLTGLKNLGNTCYMNSMIQCLSATIPLARFFKEGRYKSAINRENPLGTKGVLADAVAQLIRSLWSEQYRFLAPVTFREAICRFAPQFKGSDQHDSQEFLAFLLDGLHEDLNLVRQKPPPIEFTPEREKELETLPTLIAAEREWNIYLRRDDSIIVRLLQGQYKSQLRCLTCGTTSTTYNTFMYLSLPIPSGRGIKEVTLAQCIDFFTQPETLDGDDAWNCPKCKTPRRATKALTISRLPPILLIHLKRFSFHGPFTDKIDTAVLFPVRNLDMSHHLPPPLSPHIKAKYEQAIGHTLDEPTTQVYDLHAVSNHFGNLSSGHYTAFVRNRGQWHELNDSKIGRLTEAQVASANKSAYTLWYSRRQS